MKSSNTVFASTTNGIMDARGNWGKAGWRGGGVESTFGKAWGCKNAPPPTYYVEWSFHRIQFCKRHGTI